MRASNFSLTSTAVTCYSRGFNDARSATRRPAFRNIYHISKFRSFSECLHGGGGEGRRAWVGGALDSVFSLFNGFAFVPTLTFSPPPLRFRPALLLIDSCLARSRASLTSRCARVRGRRRRVSVRGRLMNYATSDRLHHISHRSPTPVRTRLTRIRDAGLNA